MESLKKVVLETNGRDHSLMINICEEHDSHQTIFVMDIFTMDPTPTSHICTFCRGLGHVVGNCPYRSSQVPIFAIKLIFGTT